MQSFDYYEVIKDDIRNFRPLNKYQFEYIKTIPTEDKDELLHIFNDSLRFLGESLFSAENSVVRESRRPSDASVK